MSESLDVLLVSPWSGGSHLAWAQGWQRSSRHRIHLLSHESGAWRWRMRGAAVTLAEATGDWVRERGRPDAIVATDMLDLGSYLGLTRRTTADVPAAIYMHENQLNYPRQVGESLDQGLAWTTWRSLVAADAVWFNSEFHRTELLGSLPEFLGRVPDHEHTHLIDIVAERSSVVPVGVDVADIRSRSVDRDSDRDLDRRGPLVLSNHRWHHDKDVGAILRGLIRLADRGVPFSLAVVGDDQGGQREQLLPLIEHLGSRVIVSGQVPREEYLELLSRSDIVVSAARNEFFGISVVEAVAAGALPVLPRALAYPEVIPEEFHDQVLFDGGDLTSAIEGAITGIASLKGQTSELADHMLRYDWSVVAPLLDDSVERMA